LQGVDLNEIGRHRASVACAHTLPQHAGIDNSFMPAPSADWSPEQYLKFEDDRTRPARDLLAQVPLTNPATAIDLGCGPGNSTELILNRYPQAAVSGMDSSPNMLEQARKRLPQCTFFQAGLETWSPAEPVDLLFANAVFQWLPDHAVIMARLLGTLPPSAVLAVQMPDNTKEPTHALMTEFAKSARWANNRKLADAARGELAEPSFYYDALRPHGSRVEIWQTIYNHVMPNAEAIVEWFKGSALRPFLAALDPGEADEFLAAYTTEVASHYPARSDGRLLLRFPRLFIVATR
jgi:trans-aconitate 2-methyltransferase